MASKLEVDIAQELLRILESRKGVVSVSTILTAQVGGDRRVVVRWETNRGWVVDFPLDGQAA
jgi:hypothetical protein